MLELLHLSGRSLPHAVLMMIPEAWENHAEMDARKRAFYEFHASLMEPWDGPACVVFTAWLSALNTVCRAYSGLVPMSPKTTPSAPSVSATIPAR